MTDKPGRGSGDRHDPDDSKHDPDDSKDAADPRNLEEQRKALDAESLRNEAALRDEPEDKRASARQTTPAGKARSK